MMVFIGWLTVATALGVLCFAAMHAFDTYLDRREPHYLAVWLNRPK